MPESPGHPPADTAAARRGQLAAAAKAWPQPTDASKVRRTTQEFATRFWTQMNHPLQACAVCALPSTAVPVSLHNLRDDHIFQLGSVHLLLSGRRYVAEHVGLYPTICPAGFIGLPVERVLEAGVPVPLECTTPILDSWLLHLTPTQKETWAAQAISNAASEQVQEKNTAISISDRQASYVSFTCLMIKTYIRLGIQY